MPCDVKGEKFRANSKNELENYQIGNFEQFHSSSSLCCQKSIKCLNIPRTDYYFHLSVCITCCQLVAFNEFSLSLSNSLSQFYVICILRCLNNNQIQNRQRNDILDFLLPILVEIPQKDYFFKTTKTNTIKNTLACYKQQHSHTFTIKSGSFGSTEFIKGSCWQLNCFNSPVFFW